MAATMKEARAWLDAFSAAGGFYSPQPGGEGCFGWPPELPDRQANEAIRLITSLRSRPGLRAKVHQEAARRRDQANVIRLPTAAPRKVQQRLTRAHYAAKRALPKHPAEYISPRERRLRLVAELIHDVSPTPALVIALGVLQTMEPEQREKIAKALGDGGSTERLQALAFTRIAGMDLGDRHYLSRALDRIREGQQ